MCLHEFMYSMCVEMTLKATKGFLDPLELELQTVVNYQLWVLENKLESSGIAASALTC